MVVYRSPNPVVYERPADYKPLTPAHANPKPCRNQLSFAFLDQRAYQDWQALSLPSGYNFKLADHAMVFHHGPWH